MNILISPYSKTRPDGKPSAKNYPYWTELVELLKKNGAKVTQIGITGEPPIGAQEFWQNMTLGEITKMLHECDIWLSVDNFFQHLAWAEGKKGIAIFGPSDPKIFGHPENINVLKSVKCLREKQFFVWHNDELDPSKYPSADEVFKIVMANIEVNAALNGASH